MFCLQDERKKISACSETSAGLVPFLDVVVRALRDGASSRSPALFVCVSQCVCVIFSC